MLGSPLVSGWLFGAGRTMLVSYVRTFNFYAYFHLSPEGVDFWLFGAGRTMLVSYIRTFYFYDYFHLSLLGEVDLPKSFLA